MAKDKSPIKLREKVLKNGNKSLYLDTYKDGVRTYETLHLYIVPERTAIDKERNKATYQQAETHRARRILELQSNKYGTADTKLLRQNMSLVSVIEEKIKSCKTISSAKGYETIKGHIIQLGDVKLQSVNKAFILKYLKFLEDTELKGGASKVYYSRLNTILNMAVRKEYIPNNPCILIDPDDRPKSEGRKIDYLTIDELKVMREAECPNREVKRAFFFACFTGLRWSDLNKLTYGNIEYVNGRLQIVTKQKKTRNYVHIPLSDNALRYLNDGGTIDVSNKPKTERVFNMPCQEAVTRDVKTWAERAGIVKRVTFHVSRHTCATLLLTYGADLYTVSKILGHTDIKTTQIYAEVVNAKRAEAVNNVPEL